MVPRVSLVSIFALVYCAEIVILHYSSLQITSSEEILISAEITSTYLYLDSYPRETAC